MVATRWPGCRCLSQHRRGGEETVELHRNSAKATTEQEDRPASQSITER